MSCVAFACRQEKKAPSKPLARNTIQARVLTVQTTIAPGSRQFNNEVIVVGSKVRLTSDVDRWRLFDLEKNEIVEVDEVTRTYRHRGLNSLIQEKQAMLRTPTPPNVPQLTVRRSGRTQQIAGENAHEWLMEAGGFRRALWLSDSALIGERFWPLFIASESAGGPYPARTAAMHLALLKERGFPLLDEIEVSLGDKPMRVQRKLLKSEEKGVARELIELPRDFDDVTPTIRPGGRPAASSSPAGRSTPAAGSQPSARSQRNP